MTLYFLNYITIPIYNCIVKKRNLSLILVCMQMFLILALRHESMGPDALPYYLFYDDVSKASFSELFFGTRFFINHDLPSVWRSFESGYVWINWIFSSMGIPFHTYLVIHSAFCIYSLYHFLNKYSKNPLLSVAVIIAFSIFQWYFYILRQMLALSILFYIVDYIKSRQFFKFLTVLCVMVLFHRTSVLILPIYFLYNIKITKMLSCKILFFFLCETYFIMLIYDKLVITVLLFIGKYGSYSMKDFQYNNLILLMLLLYAGITLLTNDKFYTNNESNKVFYWFFVMSLFVEGLSFVSPIFARASIGLFFPFVSVLIANTICNIRPKSAYIIVDSIFYISLTAFYYYRISNDIFIKEYITFWGASIK